MTASAPSSEGNSSLAIKCMDFCHALASQGMAFSFSLSVGSDFSFSLDARDKKQATPVLTAEVTKKKLSPSQVRRNAKRRKEFLKRKSETSDKEKLGNPPAPAQPFVSRRLVTKLRRRANTWTFSQLDGTLPSPPSSPSGQPKEEEDGFNHHPGADGVGEGGDLVHCMICFRCKELCQETHHGCNCDSIKRNCFLCTGKRTKINNQM